MAPVVLLAAAAALALLVLEMSHAAPRIAGSNHISMPVFAADVPGGGTLCQPAASPPPDARRVQLLIGTFGRPLPPLRISFMAGERVVAAGALGGAAQPEGEVEIPLRGASAPGADSFCLHVGGSHGVVLGGEAGAGGTETVDGHRQPGDIGLTYLRGGRETWWQLLPTLDVRFGLGKASAFGDWTLPAAVLVMALVWFSALRLLLRELRD